MASSDFIISLIKMLKISSFYKLIVNIHLATSKFRIILLKNDTKNQKYSLFALQMYPTKPFNKFPYQ